MSTPWTWDIEYPPPVLTPSGSHHNTYGWKAGGTHPTGIFSCSLMISGIFPHELEKTILRKVTLNPSEVRLNIKKLQNANFPMFNSV